MQHETTTGIFYGLQELGCPIMRDIYLFGVPIHKDYSVLGLLWGARGFVLKMAKYPKQHAMISWGKCVTRFGVQQVSCSKP